MPPRFIMTAFGVDRPGIVADVTEILYKNGCNLKDSSMTLLAGEFTLVLLFSAPSADVAGQLSTACRRLEQEKHVSAFFRPVESLETVPAGNITPRTIHVEGLDHAGIVYKVSRYLADQQINIVDLKATVKASPESGTTLYVMDIVVHMPDGIAAEALDRGLSAVADELNVDIVLTAT